MNKCPKCDKILDGWTQTEPDTHPEPGDVTICVYCSAVLQYTDDMLLRFADADAVAEVMLQLSQAQNAIKELHEMH